MIKAICRIILVLMVLLGLILGGQYLGIQWYRVISTEMESATTDVYRNNKSYVEGTVRDLREMRVEYEKANDSHKSALKSLILQRANELDWERLPIDLRTFLERIK